MDVSVEKGSQAEAIVNYLLEHSDTFKKAYEALDADHDVHLTIRDATASEKELGRPSQFIPGPNGTGTIVFNDVNMNNGNWDREKSARDLGGHASFAFTAASVVGHELGHAAGHWTKVTGVPSACAGDPHAGSSGCVIRFENRVRNDLPGAPQGGTRPSF